MIICRGKHIFRGQVNKTKARPGPNARCRGQLVEAEAEAKILVSRPVWSRVLNINALITMMMMMTMVVAGKCMVMSK